MFDRRGGNGRRKVSPEVLGRDRYDPAEHAAGSRVPAPHLDARAAGAGDREELRGDAVASGPVEDRCSRWGSAGDGARRWCVARGRPRAARAGSRSCGGWPRTRRPREAVVYADEVDLHLNPKIGHDWMLPGTQRLVVTPGKNEKRYLAGGLRPGPAAARLGRRRPQGELAVLEPAAGAARAYPGARVIHLILDNYIIHKSRWPGRGCAARARSFGCTSCRPTARTRTGSSGCGRTCTPTSPATTSARPCSRCWPTSCAGSRHGFVRGGVRSCRLTSLSPIQAK